MTVVDQKMTVFRTHSRFGICTTTPDYVSVYVVFGNHVMMVCEITCPLLRYITHLILDATPSTLFLETML
jgi:hypothetical protein